MPLLSRRSEPLHPSNVLVVWGVHMCGWVVHVEKD